MIFLFVDDQWPNLGHQVLSQLLAVGTFWQKSDVVFNQFPLQTILTGVWKIEEVFVMLVQDVLPGNHCLNIVNSWQNGLIAAWRIHGGAEMVWPILFRHFFEHVIGESKEFALWSFAISVFLENSSILSVCPLFDFSYLLFRMLFGRFINLVFCYFWIWLLECSAELASVCVLVPKFSDVPGK